MKISYNVTVDDMVELHRFSWKTAAVKNNIARISVYYSALVFVIMFICLYSLESIYRFAFAAFGALSCLVIYPDISRHLYARRLREQYNLTEYPVKAGPHELEVTENALIIKSKLTEYRFKFSTLSSIDTFCDRVYISIPCFGGIMIPAKTTILEGDRDAMVTELTKIVAMNRNSLP